MSIKTHTGQLIIDGNWYNMVWEVDKDNTIIREISRTFIKEYIDDKIRINGLEDRINILEEKTELLKEEKL